LKSELNRKATHASVEAVWRIESARLIGGLVRLLRDLDEAEDLAQDALVVALEQWPHTGIPDNPGAWLMTTAKRRAVDTLRHRGMVSAKHLELAKTLEYSRSPADGGEAVVDDDVLRLILIACHPVLPAQAAVALTLRLIAGLTTAEIARAYLLPEATIAQRIVRAKKAIAAAGVAFEEPSRAELPERLMAVLSVIYLIFNEGYTASSGKDWLRPPLIEESLRLARLLAGLAARHAEAHGLLALLELQASRTRARLGPGGEPRTLAEQDRSRWDRLLITRGLASLARAESLDPRPGPYTIQAAIAACHARAASVEQTDWGRIVALYDLLLEATPSPVIELNRAVAISMARGPAEALDRVNALADVPALRNYHLLPAVRADLLTKLGRFDEARLELAKAADLAANGQERALLMARIDKLGPYQDAEPRTR
jgi:RNA polymerase sigma-70 factor (ECF subfamily)